MDSNTPRLLRDSEVEQILGVAKGWAAKDRISTARIPHIRIGRAVRYRLSDVQNFIDANARRSTSEAA